MNKTELAQKIADKVGITKAQAEAALGSFTEIATLEMQAGNEVVLTGFGTFSARARKGREGINPRNPQEKIVIPTVVVAKFKAGKNLKDALKGKSKSVPISDPPIEAVPTPEATIQE
ncbi:MAG: HU family DNA-binding protein [Patescibacteria group bacterium]